MSCKPLDGETLRVMEFVFPSLGVRHAVCYHSTPNFFLIGHFPTLPPLTNSYFFFLYGSTRPNCFPAPINIYSTKEWLHLSHKTSCDVMEPGAGIGASWVALRRWTVHGSN
ncbi:hypothetical protein CRENBAI_026901 [Crenichthys baileyi]|uniref:Uncharacterized protein n=1 Tax=Crenichthys baileyi TaxID=28760 RepID=A0AAV9R407_9TELE